MEDNMEMEENVIREEMEEYMNTKKMKEMEVL